MTIISLKDISVPRQTWRHAAAMIRRARQLGFQFSAAPLIQAEKLDGGWKVRFAYRCHYGRQPMTAFLFCYEKFPPGMAIVPGVMTDHCSIYPDAIALFDWSRWEWQGDSKDEVKLAEYLIGRR